MRQVYFWNAEHLSSQAEVLAETRQVRVERAGLSVQAELAYHASKNRVVSPAVTRSKILSVRAGSGITKPKSNRPPARQVYSNDPTVQRQMEREVRHVREVEALEYKARVSKRKLKTQVWLESQVQPVFYCEVQQGFLGITSSLRNVVAPSPHTLCYWISPAVGAATEPVGFPATVPGVAGPPGGPHLINGNDRIPKIVVHAGLNLFFWHAPSGNQGHVVVAVWNWINNNYVGHNILFGDLNTDPGRLFAHGIPLAQICQPAGPTRISGRTLDYALSNVPGVTVHRAFEEAVPHREIKKCFGSDHAAMCLNW